MQSSIGPSQLAISDQPSVKPYRQACFAIANIKTQIDAMLFNPSRDEARRFFIQTWQKHRQNHALADLEAVLVDVLMAHPEYHSYLSVDYLDHDWPPEHGDTNPFLHLSLHLALAEQLSIDQPAGVRQLYQQLHQQQGDAHKALHIMLDCLAEMIWQAQRNQTQPDPAIYLAGIRRHLGLFQ